MKKRKEKEVQFNPNLQTTTAEPRAMVGEIPIFCSHDSLVEIDKIIPNKANPNRHPQDQIILLAQIMKGQGVRSPITVSTRSGLVVKGHGRLQASKLIEMTHYPVDYQNYASEAEELADLIADNRIAELAEIDNRALLDMLQQLDTGEIPLDFTGFDEQSLADLICSFDESIPKEKEEKEGDLMPFTMPQDIWLLKGSRLEVGDSVEGVDTIIKAFIKDQSISNVKLIRDGEQYSVQKIIEYFG